MTVASHGSTKSGKENIAAIRGRGKTTARVKRKVHDPAPKKMSFYDRAHARLDAEERLQPSKSQRDEWRFRGYPELEYNNPTFVMALETRVRRICAEYIKGIITTEDSHYHRVLREKIGKQQRIGTVEGAFMQVEPGYYGPRGKELMWPLIMEEVIHEVNIMQDTPGSLVRMRGGGGSAYILSVLVPEVAVRLIMEDLAIHEEAAIAVLNESRRLGEAFHKEQ